MQVRDVMTSGVECVKPSDNLGYAAERMRDLNVGCLPVCGNDRLVGMITDRDIVIRGVAGRTNAEVVSVADVMTPDINYCFEDDSIDEAAQRMEELQIRRLAVLNGDKRLVGIVSLGDLAVRGNDAELSAEALEQISEPAAPAR